MSERQLKFSCARKTAPRQTNIPKGKIRECPNGRVGWVKIKLNDVTERLVAPWQQRSEMSLRVTQSKTHFMHKMILYS